MAAYPKETTNANNGTTKVAETLKKVGYDVRELVNDTINAKILGITKNAQIFNALDCIDLAQKIHHYDMIRAIINERLDKFFEEQEKEL